VAAPATSSEALVQLNTDPLIVSWREKAKTFKTEALALVVDSDEADTAATNMLGVAVAIGKAAEQKRTALVKPHNDTVRTVNDFFKRELQPFTDARAWLDERVLAWRRKKRRLQAEADALAERERLRAAALETQAVKAEQAGETAVAGQLLDQAVASETAASRAEQVAATPIRNTIVTPMGASTVQRHWSFKVSSLAEVPREYLMLDEVAIRRALRESPRDKDGRPTLEIAGLEIVEDERLAVRG
jgi:hypothetical protein